MDEPVKEDVAIILLAAGSSSRMGKSKQLISIQGETLLEKSVKTALHSKGKNIIVVLGANEAQHRGVIEDLPVSIVYNPHWQNGMGSSIKSGLKRITIKSEALIIMVCDQPLLTSSHLDTLIDHYKSTRTPIVASSYSGVIGVPALFDKSLFARLSLLEDSQGAKKIIESGKEFTDSVNFPEGSIDLDTPEDLHQFFKD
jgi:molybdenum cofactor cytidylyltransferase